MAAQLDEAGSWEFDAYIPISALRGTGLAPVVGELTSRLPDGPLYYPPGSTTDQPEQLLVAEIVREKFLGRLREELPHSLTVQVRDMEERPGGVLYIDASVIVERPSQKPIVLGRGGELLASAGRDARRELEVLFGTKVYLDLRVRVEKDWQRQPELLDRLGFGD